MSTFNFAGAFSANTIADSFNPAIVRDAGNGGVSTVFAQALETQYGYVLALTPRTAIGQINKFVGTDKAPKKSDWAHGKASAVGVAQALHALGVAMHASGKIKNLATLAPLSAWCCPIAIAAATAAKAAAKAVADTAKAAEKLRLDAVLVAAASEQEIADTDITLDTVPAWETAPITVWETNVVPVLDPAPVSDNQSTTTTIVKTILSGALSNDNLDEILCAVLAMTETVTA